MTNPQMLPQGMSAVEMQRLAAERPDLWPAILEHPNIYPELQNWIQWQLNGQVPAGQMPAGQMPAVAVLQADKKPSKAAIIVLAILIPVILIGSGVLLWFSGVLHPLFGLETRSAQQATQSEQPLDSVDKPQETELQPTPKPDPEPVPEVTAPPEPPPAVITLPQDCDTMNPLAATSSRELDNVSPPPAGSSSSISTGRYFDDPMIGQKAKTAMRQLSGQHACAWRTSFHGGAQQYTVKITESVKAPFITALRESDFVEIQDGPVTLFVIEYNRDHIFTRVQHLFVDEIWVTITDSHGPTDPNYKLSPGMNPLAESAIAEIFRLNPHLKK